MNDIASTHDNAHAADPQNAQSAQDAILPDTVHIPLTDYGSQNNPNTPAKHDNALTDEQITPPPALTKDYRFIRLLGEGSNGKTWLARTLIGDTTVAIKSLKFSQLESLKSYELFQREAQVLKSLDIHGVPKLYKTILHSKDGDCALVQQYIDAPSLQSYLDKGRKFNEHEALCLMRKLAEILRELELNYAPAIIHRDIKPSNILCWMPEQTDNAYAGSIPEQAYNAYAGSIPEQAYNAYADIDPWLIDFGAVANPQKRQQGSTVAGTLGYMAPEQIVGDSAIQSDYYALGATILHMLTGVPPYDIPSELFSLQFKPVIAQLSPDTSENMIELLDILLDKNPTNRPQNISEFIQYIENVMQGRSPKDDKPAPPVRLLTKIKKTFRRILSLFNPSVRHLTTKGTLTGTGTLIQNLIPSDPTAYCTGQCQYYVAFYYTVKGNTYSNIAIIPANTYLNLNARVHFPTECDIKYDANNISFSTIDQDALNHIISDSAKIADHPQEKAPSNTNSAQTPPNKFSPAAGASPTHDQNKHAPKNKFTSSKAPQKQHIAARPRANTC
ncbi:MAG: serine/threonine protein kinase [Proteobacteria bacterium]|nr:serine/threonine protein kinase [Pseudomonadota bacterium]